VKRASDRQNVLTCHTRVKEERERLWLRFNDLVVSSQATQWAADDARVAMERLLAEDIARAEEITRIRSEAATSVLTIEDLRCDA